MFTNVYYLLCLFSSLTDFINQMILVSFPCTFKNGGKQQFELKVYIQQYMCLVQLDDKKFNRKQMLLELYVVSSLLFLFITGGSGDTIS